MPRMDTPSIERALSRAAQERSVHPFILYLYGIPVVRSLVKQMMRVMRHDSPQARWATLPPVTV